MPPPGQPYLVHGMGKTLVPSDWPPLTDEEVSLVLGGTRTGAVVTWHSPRPMSAAGLVSWRGATLVVKRHHVSVRTVGQLAVEHAFARYLRARGLPVPAVVPLDGGATAVRRCDFSYEAHLLAAGIDLYREAVSWSPFAAVGHARSAGAALARLHRAAEGYAAPARPPGVLISSCAVILATDPVGRVARILARRPGLSRWMARRPWRDDGLRRSVRPLPPPIPNSIASRRRRSGWRRSRQTRSPHSASSARAQNAWRCSRRPYSSEKSC